MKSFLSIFILIIFPFNSFAYDEKESFFNSITAIFLYDAIGHLETVNGEFTDRPPLIVPEPGSMYIYPFDLFVRIFDRHTGKVYFTRDLVRLHGHFRSDELTMDIKFVPGIDDNLSIFMNNSSEANLIYIDQRENDFYFILAYSPCNCEFFHLSCDIDFNALIIIDEVQINFYRPIGRITESITNIFFVFEEVEKSSGTIIFDYVNLSNLDILKHLHVIQAFIETNDVDFLNLPNNGEYYLELINEASFRVKNNHIRDDLFHSFLDPFEIRHILWELVWCDCGNTVRTSVHTCDSLYE